MAFLTRIVIHPPQDFPLIRSLAICSVVASLSCWIQGIELSTTARGLQDPTQVVSENTPPLEWVRTKDGWEQASMLQVSRRVNHVFHPGIVAGLQLLLSLFVLLAFPTPTFMFRVRDSLLPKCPNQSR